MATNPYFADWYRTAGLVPPAGLLDKRWAAVEEVSKVVTPALLQGLAELFTSTPTNEVAAVPPGFREPFKQHDDAFPLRENLQEMRVLAGATLRVVIDDKHELAPLAALALVCGSFGPREAALPEPEHLAAANRFLITFARDARKYPTAVAINTPKSGVSDSLTANLFAVNQTPQLHQPLVNAINKIASDVSLAVSQTKVALDQLRRVSAIRDEEVGILWWLQTHFSRTLQQPFSSLGAAAAAVILPMDLAELTTLLPGPENVAAVLLHALLLAGSKSDSEATTIPNAANLTPRHWRERVCVGLEKQASGVLMPVSLAIQTSLKTDRDDDWLPVYRKLCDISPSTQFPLVQIALQFFREQMLVKAVAERNS